MNFMKFQALKFQISISLQLYTRAPSAPSPECISRVPCCCYNSATRRKPQCWQRTPDTFITTGSISQSVLCTACTEGVGGKLGISSGTEQGAEASHSTRSRRL